MKFIVKHEINGRLRIHVVQKRMTYTEADTLSWFLSNQKNVTDVKVYERTADAVICYVGDKEEILNLLKQFSYENAILPEHVAAGSGRELNAVYQEKLVMKTVLHYGNKLFLPMPVRAVITSVKSVKYIWHGIRCLMHGKIEVPVLDATAISVSVFRRDYATAGSVMFLLGIGEIIEEWTHKKSVGDLARSMSLNVNKVWLKRNEQEILVKSSDIEPGDHVMIRMGNVIPFDGEVVTGEGMVNQASLTGESMPVAKRESSYAYAGTVVEEGSVVIKVRKLSSDTKISKIIELIDNSENLKAGVQSKAERLADSIVPYSFLAFGLTLLFTRNVTKAVSVLMVDYSCAIKLSTPIAVISAIKEAADDDVTVKGGKYLEEYALADSIVFDKTGTLTNAEPVLEKVIALGDYSEAETLKIAACLEEHFPHSVARAIVKGAADRDIDHAEEHAEVQYIVAHGISTTLHGKRAIIGSRHFVCEDEGIEITDEQQAEIDEKSGACSVVYLAVGDKLTGALCISDPPRPEAEEAVKQLKEAGITNIVMLTGDSAKAAEITAQKLGISDFRAQVLPEDKHRYVQQLKEHGHRVIMVGDGINDAPALAAANVSVAMSDASDIAKETADITVRGADLTQLAAIRQLSEKLMHRINSNYRFILLFNSVLLLSGAFGLLQPSASALLHNASTMAICAKSMTPLEDKKRKKKNK